MAHPVEHPVSLHLLDRSPGSGSPTARRAAPAWRPRTSVGVGLAAAIAVAAWLPFLGVPLSPDEGGFLLLAQHWSPGTSLYGSYWVDRPPLLLWLFSLAGHLGPVGHGTDGLTAPTVKLLGAAASGAAVVLAAVVAHVLAPSRRTTSWVTVALAVGLLSSPLLGMPETNGEVLAVPFVLVGIACLVAATRREWGRDAAFLTAAAGAAATSALLVKQNVVDVFVFALVLLVSARHHVSGLGGRLLAFAGASAAVLAAALAGAALRGTSPAGLWDAVVVFRLEASAVIRASASAATSERMSHLALAALASGVAVLLVVAGAGAVPGALARRDRRTRPQPSSPDALRPALTRAALATAVWELCGVALGGSYWLHYLTGLVPGVLLLAALVPSSGRWRPVLAACTGYAILASGVVWVHHVAAPVTISDDARVVAYLRAHARPSDGVVAAFGHPDVVAGSGLSSPYEYLWSLPVRVRDPRLRELGGVLRGPQAPRWVVVAGESLASWGLDATSAQRILTDHYREQVTYGDWHVWRQRTEGGTR